MTKETYLTQVEALDADADCMHWLTSQSLGELATATTADVEQVCESCHTCGVI